jgi:6-phosphogluconolactonase/glucosamine-6-phosphate isomerase/deaminase
MKLAAAKRGRYPAAVLDRQGASLAQRSAELSFQAITIFLKDEIHAPVGTAGSFIEAADRLILMTGCRTEGNLFGPAEVDPLLSDHTSLPFSCISRSNRSSLK